MASKQGVNGVFVVIGIIIFGIIVYNVVKEEPSKSSSSAGETGGGDSYSGAYRLEFSEDFNRALASQDDLGVSIMIALDCSGSMADNLSDSSDSTPKYQLASQSLNEVVGFLEDFYRTRIKGQGIILKLGLMRFSDEVSVLFDLHEMDETYFKDIERIAARPDVFRPGGKTAIGETIKAGAEILAESGTIFKSLIIITDGENTVGEDPEIVLEAVVENRNNKSTKDFPVLTSSVLVSFIGFDMEADAFTSLRTIGSRVMSAGSKEALNDSLKNLFLADITKLEAK